MFGGDIKTKFSLIGGAAVVSLVGVVIWWMIAGAGQGLICRDARPAEPLHGRPIKVFLLGGQSNMDGFGDGERLIESDLERLERVGNRVLLSYNGGDLRRLGLTERSQRVREKHGLGKTFGPELFFGILLAERFPDDRFIFMKRSKGGSSLYGSWNPNWSRRNAKLMGEASGPRLYREWMNDYRSLESCYRKGELELCGVLWVQGEADSNVDQASEAYGANLSNLVGALRRDLESPLLPFFFLEVGHGKVVEGMRSLSEGHPEVVLIARDPVAFSVYTDGEGQGPIDHYDSAGMREIGRRFAEAWSRR